MSARKIAPGTWQTARDVGELRDDAQPDPSARSSEDATNCTCRAELDADHTDGPHRCGRPDARLERRFFAVTAERVDLSVNDDKPVNLVNALAALDPRDRDVLVMRHLAQWSTGEMARKLGITDEAVKSRLLRAVLRLRGLLEPES